MFNRYYCRLIVFIFHFNIIKTMVSTFAQLKILIIPQKEVENLNNNEFIY